MPTSGWTNAATTELQDDGFGLVPQLISTWSCEALVKLIDSAPEASWERRGDGTAFAIRNAHLKVEGLLTALTGAGVIAFMTQTQNILHHD